MGLEVTAHRGHAYKTEHGGTNNRREDKDTQTQEENGGAPASQRHPLTAYRIRRALRSYWPRPPSSTLS